MTIAALLLGGLPGSLSILPRAAAQNLDIRSFGARCDGSDDTGAVQSALNATPSGGTLTFSCKAAVTTVQLVKRSNVTIAGANGGGISMRGFSSDIWTRALLIVECASCTIRDLAIDGNRQDYVPFEIRYSSNTTVSGLNITNVNHAGCAFLAYGNNGNKYLNNNIQTVDPDRNPANTDTARGMLIGGVAPETKEINVTISGNRLADIAGSAIVVEGSGMTISNNTLTQINWSCIKVLPLGGVGSTLIASNRCSGAGARWVVGGGIMTEYYNSSSETTVIRDNLLEGYGDADAGRSVGAPSVGINIANESGKWSRNVQILKNTIRNFFYDSIQITSNLDNWTIDGNLIERTISGGPQWNGVAIQMDSGFSVNNGSIRNNLIRGKFDGIRLAGSNGSINGLTLDNNAIVNTSRDGLHIEMSGAGLNGLNLNNNCFSAIGYKSIWDNRGVLGLANVLSSCSDPTSGATLSTSTTQPVLNNNTGSTTTTTTTTPPQNLTVVRVNAAGPAYTDPSGKQWSADFGYSGGFLDNVQTGIANTSTPALYQTSRWNDKYLQYRFPVQNGTYTVNLKFAETYFSNPGQRVFSVSINGQTVLPNFDIISAAGGKFRAVDKAFTVNVTGGVVNLEFRSSVDDPQVNAIEIY